MSRNEQIAVTEHRSAGFPFWAGKPSPQTRGERGARRGAAPRRALPPRGFSDLAWQIADAHAEGQRTWPQVALELEPFRAHCERVLGDAPPDGWRAHAAELYLCCACAQGNAAAHLTLRRVLLTRVEAALRKAHSDEELVAESLHALEIKLLVGPDAKIARYAARGPLLGWLHMAARRSVLDQLTRFRARKPWLDTAFAVEEPRHHQPDPVQGILCTRYAASSFEAVKSAVLALSLADRRLLQQALLEGATIETLGEAYAIHRSTAARRLQRVRQQIADAVRQDLSRSFSLSECEFTEIGAALREQLAPALAELLSADVARMEHSSRRRSGQSTDGEGASGYAKNARVSSSEWGVRGLARRLQ